MMNIEKLPSLLNSLINSEKKMINMINTDKELNDLLNTSDSSTLIMAGKAISNALTELASVRISLLETAKECAENGCADSSSRLFYFATKTDDLHRNILETISSIDKVGEGLKNGLKKRMTSFE